MVRFQIPDTYLAGFETLLSLQREEIEQLSHFLKNIPVGTGPQTFGNHFDLTFKFQPPFTRQLAASIYSLGSFTLSQKGKLHNQELAEALAQSFGYQNPKFTEEQLKNLSVNLEEILMANNPLAMTFKAFGLLSENESVIRENHIITDIRLLFNEDIRDSQRHGLVIHQLRLIAEENDEQNDYYFNLTTSDLQKLQEQITRAIEKEKLILEDYKNISFINITE